MRLVLVVLSALLFGISARICAALPAPDVRLTAITDRTTYREGQAVPVTLRLHNSGPSDAVIGGGAVMIGQPEFVFEMRDAAGKPVAETAYGQRALAPWMGGSIGGGYDFFKPGATTVTAVDLARCFDLSRTGVYTFQAQKTLWMPLPADAASRWPHVKPFVVTAPPVTFRLTENAQMTSGPVALTLPQPHRCLFLSTIFGSEQISRLLIGENGDATPTLTPITAGNVSADFLTTTPSGRFLYAVSKGQSGVSQFSIGSDGTLRPLSPSTVPTWSSPTGLIMDPKGRFLYVHCLFGFTNMLMAIGADGRLRVTQQDTLDDWTRDPVHHLDPSFDNGVIDPSGRFLYLYEAPSINVYRLQPDGRVTLLTPKSQELLYECMISSISFTPSGRFAYVLYWSDTTGTPFPERIVPCRVGLDGLLTTLPSAIQPHARGGDIPERVPKALAIDPSGRYLMGVIDSGAIIRYRITQTGALVWIGTTPDDNDNPFTGIFDPTGRNFYLLNENMGSDNWRQMPSGVSAYRLNAAGVLTRITPPYSSPTYYGYNPGWSQMVMAETPAAPQWSRPSGGLSVAASLTQDVFQSSEPVALTVRLRNVTSHAIALAPAGEDAAAFHLNVIRQPPEHDPYNIPILPTPVPMLAAGRDLFQEHPTGRPLLLPPGAERQYRFLLSRLFDLSTEVGPTADATFTMQVSRPVPGANPAALPVLTFRVDDPLGFQFWNETEFGPAINSQP